MHPCARFANANPNPSGTVSPGAKSAVMDQNLRTEAQTLTKTLCGRLAAAQFANLTAAAKREARRWK